MYKIKRELHIIFNQQTSKQTSMIQFIDQFDAQYQTMTSLKASSKSLGKGVHLYQLVAWPKQDVLRIVCILTTPQWFR